MRGTKQVEFWSYKGPYDNNTGPRINLYPKRGLELILGFMWSLQPMAPAASLGNPVLKPSSNSGLAIASITGSAMSLSLTSTTKFCPRFLTSSQINWNISSGTHWTHDNGANCISFHDWHMWPAVLISVFQLYLTINATIVKRAVLVTIIL